MWVEGRDRLCWCSIAGRLPNALKALWWAEARQTSRHDSASFHLPGIKPTSVSNDNWQSAPFPCQIARQDQDCPGSCHADWAASLGAHWRPWA